MEYLIKRQYFVTTTLTGSVQVRRLTAEDFANQKDLDVWCEEQNKNCTDHHEERADHCLPIPI